VTALAELDFPAPGQSPCYLKPTNAFDNPNRFELRSKPVWKDTGFEKLEPFILTRARERPSLAR